MVVVGVVVVVVEVVVVGVVVVVVVIIGTLSDDSWKIFVKVQIVFFQK